MCLFLCRHSHAPILIDAFSIVFLPTVSITCNQVSSGGMYNTKFPPFDVVASRTVEVPYDGNMVYAYCKRGQVNDIGCGCWLPVGHCC